MLQKIKSLMETKESIDEINKKLDENKQQVMVLKAEIESFKDKFKELAETQEEFLKSFRENAKLIKEMREIIDGEIYDFKVINAQTQKKLMDKFETELSKELKLGSDSLKSSADEYRKLKENILIVSDKTAMLSEEIGKFAAISSCIKKEDFELTRFARHLMQMDREKLELMRKIDTLERLVSRMRRTL